MTFYRPGGTARAPNRQQDYVYADFAGPTAATDWLPVNKGDTAAINICRASITIATPPALNTVISSAIAPEAQVLLEMRMQGGSSPIDAPIDQWQNLVVAASRRIVRAGWVRLRIININNSDGTGIWMMLQISRTGETGAVS
jgi:hypothetical protein